ncbi:MAG: flavodoxin family protein [Pseudomonadota bacterium]
MANILVLYESNNRGYTAKMAELVAQGAADVPGVQVRLLSVDEAQVDDLYWADGLALGSPTNLGGISWRMKQWWDERSFDVWGKLDGKLGCVFSSSGAWGGGAEHACQALTTLLMNFGMLVFGVTDYVAPKMAPHYGAICAGEPRSDSEREMCQRLGRRLAEWCSVYIDGDGKAHPKFADYDRSVQHV